MQGLRKSNKGEVPSGREVVFAGFINHSQLIVRLRISIGKDLVDLSSLKRNLAALIT